MRLENKTALVTGAASGIGAEVARVFEREGEQVALVDRDGAGLCAVAAEMKASLIFERDVADGAFAAATVASLKRLDVVLTAAGISVDKELADTTAARATAPPRVR